MNAFYEHHKDSIRLHYRTQLDRLYQRIVDDLDHLIRALGLQIAA